MKRIMCLVVIIVILMCVTFSGCMRYDENNRYSYKHLDEYIVIEANTFDHLSIINHNYEFVSKTEEFIKDNIPKDNFLLDGNLLFGEYKKSQSGYLYNNDTDSYIYKNGNLRIDYKINQSTGICDNYIWCDVSYVSNNTEDEKTKDECLAIAKQYLGNYVSDPDAYELIEEKLRDIPEYKQLYNFEFVRKAGGIFTSDKAVIGVTCFGKVVSHAFQSLGSLKDIGEPPEEILNEVNIEVEQKLEKIYGDIKGEYSVEYETADIILSKMKNGKIALEYYIDAKLIPKQGGEELSEKNHFIVYLE